MAKNTRPGRGREPQSGARGAILGHLITRMPGLPDVHIARHRDALVYLHSSPRGQARVARPLGAFAYDISNAPKAKTAAAPSDANPAKCADPARRYTP